MYTLFLWQRERQWQADMAHHHKFMTHHYTPPHLTAPHHPTSDTTIYANTSRLHSLGGSARCVIKFNFSNTIRSV